MTTTAYALQFIFTSRLQFLICQFLVHTFHLSHFAFLLRHALDWPRLEGVKIRTC